MKLKSKSFTHHFVQVQTETLPSIVPHTKKGNHYKFLDKSKAHEFCEDLKKNNPNDKFRVITCTETFKEGFWI